VTTSREPAVVHRREIDGLRALAVLAVVLDHFLETSGATGKAAQTLESLGSRGVDLFFVLSGFCLSYPVLERVALGESAYVPIVPFLRRRFARIAPPYYASLIIFGILSLTPFGLPSAAAPHPSALAQLRDLGCDFVFLTSFAPMHNPSYWTLGIEMRWYVVFPVLLAIFVRMRLAFAAIAVGSYALYYAGFGFPDNGTLPSFMAGFVAANIAIRRVRWAAYVWPVALAYIAVLVSMVKMAPNPDHGEVWWHVAFLALVIAVTGNRRLSAAFSWPPVVFIGVASYSIYLMHQPLLNSLIEAHVPPLVALVLALALALWFWWGVERLVVGR
jgi:peptidoglycan/LPS O-acetylase OafA/YrhL